MSEKIHKSTFQVEIILHGMLSGKTGSHKGKCVGSGLTFSICETKMLSILVKQPNHKPTTSKSDITL